MNFTSKMIHAFFYANPSGKGPVRTWLNGMSAEDRKGIGEDIGLLSLPGLSACRWCAR
jgi:hypothetical protein